MAMTEPEEYDKLLKLYELAVDEHHFYVATHQKRIEFYSGILSALLTGTVIGFLQASEWYHFALLCVGPVLIFAISAIAVQGIFRYYQRLLETITVRAKIEQRLGLTSKQPSGADVLDSYWRSEPIIPHRHIESRGEHESSQAFIDAYVNKGYQLWARRLFRVFQWLSIVILFALLSLAIWKALLMPCF